MDDAATTLSRRQQIEAILDEELELPSAGSANYLDLACAADPELRAVIVDLLDDSVSSTHGETRAFFEGESAPSLEGQTVGPYLLHRLIGVGGMGQVYEAEDTRLRRRVALKFLPAEFSRAAVVKQRFLREARAVSALDHSAICTLHDIGESDDGRLYLVMGYYPGETLEQRLKRGPLPIAEARQLAIDVTRGLQHAHQAGIIHRDIKPANVILTAGGETKILDFGIARVGDATVLTHSGQYLGTPIYMSPEQSRGEHTDARTDLWSLGVMLYEMLTGERPFAGDDILVVMNAIATRAPKSVGELRPEVPDALAATVEKLMAKDPADRYADAAELLADLESGAGPITSEVNIGSRRWWRLVVAAAVGVLLVIGLVLSIPALRQRDPGAVTGSPVTAPKLVAVLPFINNLGATPENQALAAGLTQAMTVMIVRLGTVDDSLWIVPAHEITQRGITTVAGARATFGVDTVLTGSVQKLGSTTEILLSLIDPSVQPSRILDSRAVVAPLSPELSDRAVDQLAELLGVGGDSHSRLGHDTAADTTSAVRTLYLQGLGYLQRYDQPGNLERAVAAFSEALEQDPLYGLAHAGLCEALWDTYRQTDDPALTERALASCDRAAELAADPAVLVAVGRIYYETGETRKSKAQLDRAIELEPENAEAHRWSGWVASRDGRPQAAEASFRQAIELEPGLWVYHQELGITLNDLGRYQEAAEQFEQALRRTPENYLVYNALGVTRHYLNQVAEAERLFQRSIELHPNPLAHRSLGLLYFREQQYERAVAALEDARDLHEASPSFNDWVVWSWLAEARFWAGDQEAAEAAWRRLIEIATPLYQVNPKDIDLLMLLSDAHVALGELERGAFYRGRLLAQPIDRVYVRFYIGRNYERTGDRELALDYIARALEERFDPLTVDRDPWLEDLRSEPAYQALRQQYLPADD